MKRIHRLRTRFERPLALGVVIVASVALGSILYLFHGSAATYAVSAQAEQATLAGRAAKVSNNSASGSSAVNFGTSPSSGTSRSVKITFYGSYDNDPPGSTAIAHPVIHSGAGGTGTFQDPLTFASPAGSGAYPFGQKIYVPRVQKYFIREDECAVSWTAPNGCGAVSMVDLYVGNPSSSQKVIACEEYLTDDTRTHEIILNPDANRVVDPVPLWNQATGKCGNLH